MEVQGGGGLVSRLRLAAGEKEGNGRFSASKGDWG